MIEQFIKPILEVISISMLVWILLWVMVSISKKKRGIKISFQAEITFFLFYIYIIAVMSLTVIPLPFERFKVQGEEGINIIPMVNIVRGLLEMFSPPTTFSEHSFQNIVGNIILFIPLGIFLPFFSDKYRSVNNVIILAAICSASIELMQLILRQFEIYRTVDIDDVILNTLGAIIGFAVITKLYFTKMDDIEKRGSI
ncbi:MAG: VanZ family protein [Ginsengibacter sp.]